MIQISKEQMGYISELIRRDVKFIVTGSKTLDFKRDSKDLDIIISLEDKPLVGALFKDVVDGDGSGTPTEGEIRLLIRKLDILSFKKTTIIDMLFVPQQRYDNYVKDGTVCYMGVQGQDYWDYMGFQTSTKHLVEAKLKHIIHGIKLTKDQQKHYNDILSLFQ